MLSYIPRPLSSVGRREYRVNEILRSKVNDPTIDGAMVRSTANIF